MVENGLNECMDCPAPALLHGIIIFAVATSSVAVSRGVSEFLYRILDYEIGFGS